jgi:DNA-directed RNA polymerase subunit N (RpoN/RPB10)
MNGVNGSYKLGRNALSGFGRLTVSAQAAPPSFPQQPAPQTTAQWGMMPAPQQPTHWGMPAQPSVPPVVPQTIQPQQQATIPWGMPALQQTPQPVYGLPPIPATSMVTKARTIPPVTRVSAETWQATQALAQPVSSLPPSTESFTDALLDQLRAYRNEKFNEPYDGSITYLQPVRCTGCYTPMSIKPKKDAEGNIVKRRGTEGQLYDRFLELIDPNGSYRLTILEAYDELGLGKACCRLSVRSPQILSTAKTDYNVQYASGRVHPSIPITNNIPSTGNMYKLNTIEANEAVASGADTINSIIAPKHSRVKAYYEVRNGTNTYVVTEFTRVVDMSQRR